MIRQAGRRAGRNEGRTRLGLTAGARRRAAAALGAVTLASAAAAPTVAAPEPSCRSAVYLTLDTGNMRDADQIAAILRKHDVRATFFLANERTTRGDHALDPQWDAYWLQRAAEGHAFGSHTWRHGRFVADQAGSVRYRPQFGADAGRVVALDAAQVCEELRSVETAFKRATGQSLDPLWRAPGGHATSFTLQAAQRCGFAHVHWAEAGFLGDELPSDKYPNAQLLAQALRRIQAGDVLMAHLGIWSRAERFAPALDPLIAGLKARGLCFHTLRQHPQFPPAGVAVPRELAASASTQSTARAAHRASTGTHTGAVAQPAPRAP